MGNHTSSGGAAGERRGRGRGKIVHWDGSVEEFDKPVTVAEVMLDHPQQLVVEFHSAVTQRRPTALPADKTLDINNIYLMLPMKRGKAVGLNAQESRRFLLILNSALHSKSMLQRSSSSRFLPWLARTCHANAIGEQVLVQLQKEEEMEKQNSNTEERFAFPEFLPESLEGTRSQYLCRQFSEKGWKPSLDTITERRIDGKASRRLFLKPFYSRFHEI